MNKLKLYWELYYPILLTFLSFLYSVSLWFTGNKLEGIFVGIWVPSILNIVLQLDKEEMISLEKSFQREDIEIEKKKVMTGNLTIMFIVGFIIFTYI